jgi:hypothetical protein
MAWPISRCDFGAKSERIIVCERQFLFQERQWAFGNARDTHEACDQTAGEIGG